MTPPPSFDEPFVRIGLPEIYNEVVSVKAIVANLATSAQYAETWRNKADERLEDVEDQLPSLVSRKELFTALGLLFAGVSAATPFLAQLYGG